MERKMKVYWSIFIEKHYSFFYYQGKFVKLERNYESRSFKL